MADEGTAVLEPPVTAAPETDTAAEEAPETEVFEAAPETEGDAGTPDSDTEGEDAEPLSREEHEKILKAEKAKLEESFRRREENARQKAEDETRRKTAEESRQRANNTLAGGAYNHLAQTVAAVQKVITDGENLNPQFVAGRLSELSREMAWSHAELESDAHWEHFKKVAKPTAETAEEYERSRGRKDIQGMVKALHESYVAAAMPEAEKRVRAQIKDEQAKAQENARTKDAAKTPAPTRAATTSGTTSIRSMDDADDAFGAGRISLAEYKTYRQKYGLK